MYLAHFRNTMYIQKTCIVRNLIQIQCIYNVFNPPPNTVNTYFQSRIHTYYAVPTYGISTIDEQCFLPHTDSAFSFVLQLSSCTSHCAWTPYYLCTHTPQTCGHTEDWPENLSLGSRASDPEPRIPRLGFWYFVVS